MLFNSLLVLFHLRYTCLDFFEPLRIHLCQPLVSHFVLLLPSVICFLLFLSHLVFLFFLKLLYRFHLLLVRVVDVFYSLLEVGCIGLQDLI